MVTRVSRTKRRLSPATAPQTFAHKNWLENQWVPFVLLIITTFAVFAPVCGSEFVAWDDNLNVSQNPSFNPPTVGAVLEYWTGPYLDLYVPLTYTVWGLLAAAAQVSVPDAMGIRLNPYVFHTANLLVHLAAVLAVYALLRRLVGRQWPAFAGAMLFAIHPLQVEPVAWVTGLKDVLSGMLTIAALWQYVCYADEREKVDSRGIRHGHYAISILLFLLAVLAKPSAVIFPAAALVLDRWVLRRSWGKILIAIGPMLLVSAGGIFVAKLFQTVLKPADGGHVLLRPLIATDALAFYLYKLVFPRKLGIHYDRAPLTVIHSGWLYFTWIVPAAVASAGFFFRKKAWWIFPAAALFVIALLPVLGLVPFSFQRYATVADRYAYVAMLGPALALAAALVGSAPRTIFAGASKSVRDADPTQTPPTRVPFAIATAVLLIFAGRSFVQTQVWHDNASLFHSSLETNPQSSLAYNDLAAVLMIERHPDEPPELTFNRINQAREFAQRAIELAPDSPDGYLTFGTLCDMTNDTSGAVAAFRKALELSPNKAESLDALGGALAKQGNFSEAEPLLRRAIKVNHRFAKAHLNLGLLLLQKYGPRNEEAFAETRLAVRLDAGDPRAHVNYATLLLGRGQRDAAMEHVKIALQIDPTMKGAIVLQRWMEGYRP